jgi:putative ABC transport system permease protein
MLSLLARLASRLRSVRGRGTLRSEMEEEFRLHIELRARQLVGSGLSAAEARRRARLEFGSVDRYAEEGRAARGLGAADAMRGDLRYAFRTLSRNRGFTVVAVLTLALGVGATTAIFSVVYDALLRPLTYDAADRVVVLHERSETGVATAVAEVNLLDWRAQARSFEAMAFHWNPEFVQRETVLIGGTAGRFNVVAISSDFFDVFAVQPVLGRTFTAEEASAGGQPVVLVSHRFWRNQLGGSPAAVGTPVEMLGATFEVIGVLPPGFEHPRGTDLWPSIHLFPANPHRGAKNNAAVARLQPDVRPADAQRELDRIGSRLVAAHGVGSGAAGGMVTSLRTALYGEVRTPLLMLFSASAVLLLIACTNLTTALLARGEARGRELAIRAAIGAQRGRLVRQLLTECLAIGMLGVAAGVLVALLMLHGLRSVRPPALDTVADVGLSVPALSFALLLTLATTLLFGLLPALRASGGSPVATLRSGARGNVDGAVRGVWSGLVVAEVALAVVLLTGSLLLVRSLTQVLAEPTGFDVQPVLTVDVSLPASRYDTDDALITWYARALAEAAGVPGVAHAGMVQHVPLGGVSWSGGFVVEGRGPSHGPAAYRVIGPGYVEAMGITLLRGRSFGRADDVAAPHVALVSRSLAEREWPGEDPVGKRVGDLANEPMVYRGPDDWLTVVGVVADVRQGGLLEPAEPAIYVNVLQRPDRARSAVLVLRSAAFSPAALAGVVRDRLQAIDPQVPIEVSTMEERVARSVADRRFNVAVLGLFAALALALAAAGIYAVVSYSVNRRTREIGIRLALGATPAGVRSLMQRRVMALVLAGIVLGAAAAYAAGHALRAMLWGVGPADPVTLLAVLVTLGGLGWASSYVPALRATRVDPQLTIRGD